MEGEKVCPQEPFLSQQHTLQKYIIAAIQIDSKGELVPTTGQAQFLVVALITAMALVHGTYAMSQSGTVTANAYIICPFSLTTSTRAAYPLGSNAVGNYTLRTLAACSIPGVEGLLTVTNQSNHLMFSENVPSGPVGNSPTTLPFTIPSYSFPNGTYTAKVNFTYVNTENASFSRFLMLSIANVVVEAFSVSPTSLITGSPVGFTAQLKNTGKYASGNMVLYLNITGPSTFSFTYPLNALSPGQNQTATILLSNVSGSAGTYTANAYVKYIANGTTYTSASRTVSYTISAPLISVGGPPKRPSIVNIPNLFLTAVPFYTTLLEGQSSIGQLGLLSTASAPEYANLSFPSSYSGMINLSARSVYLYPGESESLSVLLAARQGTQPGAYTIPVNITVSAVGGISESQVEYLTMIVYPSNFTLLPLSLQVDLLNNSRTASGTITVRVPPNSTGNSTLMTFIPIDAVRNVSLISAFGLPHNITTRNGRYVISWFLGAFRGSTTAYAYYTLNNLTDQQALFSTQSIYVQPSQPTPQSLIKVFSINIPTFYADTNGSITVDALYTGTSVQKVSLSVTAPPGTVVSNPSYVVNASPNQLIVARFAVNPGSGTGTQLLDLYVNTNGANLTYTIPVLVLARTSPPPSTTTVPQGYLSQYILQRIDVIFILALVAAALLVFSIARRRPRYSRERSEKLIRIRERIKNEQ